MLFEPKLYHWFPVKSSWFQNIWNWLSLDFKLLENTHFFLNKKNKFTTTFFFSNVFNRVWLYSPQSFFKFWNREHVFRQPWNHTAFAEIGKHMVLLCVWIYVCALALVCECYFLTFRCENKQTGALSDVKKKR